jgi:hypothetical protein
VLNRLLVIEDEERVDSAVALIPGDPRPSDSCFDSCFALLVEGFFATTEK